MFDIDEQGEPEKNREFVLDDDDFFYIQNLIKILEDIPRKAPLSNKEVEGLVKVIYYLEHLPEPTPGLEVSLRITHRFDQEHSYCSIAVEENTITFSEGGTSYSDQTGHDSYDSDLFVLGAGGFRSEKSTSWLYPPLMLWLSSFKDLLSLRFKIEVEDNSRIQLQ